MPRPFRWRGAPACRPGPTSGRWAEPMPEAGAPIATARLVLRRLRMDDIPALVAGLDDYAVSRWLTVVPFPYTAADARDFLAYLEAGAPWDGFGIHADEGLVGVVGIGETLGYWLARRAQGKGYMTEAAAALVGAYFSETGAESLGSGHFTGNAASRRVLEKLGFRPTRAVEEVFSRAQGRTVPLEKMRLSRADWQARHG
ncbi:MAG: N-acetyltransferase [Alphaproteobacteria bacterium]|nr:MAG: N-acetyltransferase [Alphaproteobacteria bacterium]